jgi:hypothetical protein
MMVLGKHSSLKSVGERHGVVLLGPMAGYYSAEIGTHIIALDRIPHHT